MGASEQPRDERVQTVINNLRKRNVAVQYVRDRNEALAAMLAMIPAGAVVGCGDSVTIEQTGVVAELRKRQYRVIDPMERDAAGYYLRPELEPRKQAVRAIFSADVYLVGSNAITLEGALVNTDAWGNRVSALIFGPEKVIVVVGVNKIVADTTAAIERIRNVAAPLNARRHFTKHHRTEFGELPCARTGKCVNCSHPWRLCRHTVITEGTMIREKGRLNVILVGEELGL